MAGVTMIEPDESFWKFKGHDRNVDKWFLMGSPFPSVVILVLYLFFVLRFGPKFMEKRPVYNLRNALLIYNAVQVALSYYLFHIGAEVITEVGLTESKCILEDKVKTSVIQDGIHLYLIAKLAEFLDTIFFVLRKKWNQISFLHVYHHFIMYVATWVTLKYEPTYSVIFLGTINSFVHVIMYMYYGLAAFPDLQKYLWWKKYITKLQLIQFVLVVLQVTWNYIVTPCRPSYILLTIVWIHGFLFIYLFSDFYIKSYIQKKKEDNIQKNKEDYIHDDVAVKNGTRQKNLDKSR